MPGYLPVPSYTMAVPFMVLHNTIATAGSPGNAPTVYGNFYENPPIGYVPRLDKVGPNSEKIFIADGGRYVNSANTGQPISENWTTTDGEGGEYADWGVDSKWTRAQSREAVPGNGTGTNNLADERLVWAKHGSLQRSRIANQYKFNAVFFDGHVELLGDLEGANPTLWMPKGTAVSSASTEFWPDVLTAYYLNPGPYVCPR
jgi:prepilin-type processing-associated H-X9-DG protein